MMVEAEVPAHGDAEEENYFISMTDMMVGVLFIFIIMLMSFALNFQKQADRQEDKISVAEEVGRKLEALEQRVSQRLSEIREAASARAQLLHDLRDALSREGLNVTVDEANGVLRLSEDAILFPVNGADLVGRARDNVDKLARVLGCEPNQGIARFGSL
jgi:flagellar motor protein MotB